MAMVDTTHSSQTLYSQMKYCWTLRWLGRSGPGERGLFRVSNTGRRPLSNLSKPPIVSLHCWPLTGRWFLPTYSSVRCVAILPMPVSKSRNTQHFIRVSKSYFMRILRDSWVTWAERLAFKWNRSCRKKSRWRACVRAGGRACVCVCVCAYNCASRSHVLFITVVDCIQILQHYFVCMFFMQNKCGSRVNMLFANLWI